MPILDSKRRDVILTRLDLAREFLRGEMTEEDFREAYVARPTPERHVDVDGVWYDGLEGDSPEVIASELTVRELELVRLAVGEVA